MRRTTVQKTPMRPAVRRERVRRDEADDRARDRPEVREDIRRTWWPES
ncbi:hypothetical protein ACIQNU_36225 [Streptomyces sp. NPDC091292]